MLMHAGDAAASDRAPDGESPGELAATCSAFGGASSRVRGSHAHDCMTHLHLTSDRYYT